MRFADDVWQAIEECGRALAANELTQSELLHAFRDVIDVTNEHYEALVTLLAHEVQYRTQDRRTVRDARGLTTSLVQGPHLRVVVCDTEPADSIQNCIPYAISTSGVVPATLVTAEVVIEHKDAGLAHTLRQARRTQHQAQGNRELAELIAKARAEILRRFHGLTVNDEIVKDVEGPLAQQPLAMAHIAQACAAIGVPLTEILASITRPR